MSSHIVKPGTKLRPIAMAVSLVASVSALSFGGALVSTASDHVKVASTSTLKPDKAFFAGKTIVVNVVGGPGSSSDDILQGVLPGMASYLHATLKPAYYSSVANIAPNATAAAPADGLTIGILNILTDLNDIYGNSSPLSFPLLKTPFIGGTNQVADTIVSCVGSPYKTFDQVRKSQTTVSYITATSGPANELQRLVAFAYKIPSHFITGYIPATMASGCLRGDAQIVAGSATNYEVSAGNAMSPGEIPLMLTGKEPAGSPSAYLNGEVPTIASYAAKHPPKGASGRLALKVAESAFTGPGNSFFAPIGTPAKRVAALTEALKYALGTAAGKQGALNAGAKPGYITPAAVVTALQIGIKKQPQVEAYLSYGT